MSGGGHLRSAVVENSDIRLLGKIQDRPTNKYGAYWELIEYKDKNGIWKQKKNTMFPDHFSEQEVIDSISQAYESNKTHIANSNKYLGYDNNGMEIMLYLNSEGGLISAFPHIEN